ncbi:hypothetical protein MHZ92_12255 [Sporosarcina sp. ACRSL]|uniref:hypothetical protein n=1 Tax=Sporosarcina sp. ACRSL TaxID=2918215 RepID=UPI001EF4982D|nr:hypothetical protein [Sporosarcina sp. ACRSL]MCG7344911.1 hypothetical protein [Sporosarcina sp. ACRSL]
MKKTIAIFLTAIFLISAGCSKPDEHDQIKDTVKTVVELQMNAPDEKALFQNYMSEDTESFENEVAQYHSYLEETYGPYFTESTFEQYIQTNEFVVFHWAANLYEYQLKVNEVNVEQNEVTPTNYNFTVDLDYVDKNGEKKEIQVTGVAIMRDDKIAKMSYLGDKQLLRSLLHGGLE